MCLRVFRAVVSVPDDDGEPVKSGVRSGGVDEGESVDMVMVW